MLDQLSRSKNPDDGHREARLQRSFPEFSGAILHENTIFTAKDRFWPALSSVEPEASR